MIKKRRKDKKMVYFVFIPLLMVLFLLIFFNINLWRERRANKEMLLQVQNELKMLSEQTNYSQEQKEEEDIEEEIEAIAREQLLLRKEGEKVIVISREEEPTGETEEVEKEEGLIEKLINVFKRD
jgi:cell division protein FtsB